MLTCAQRLDDAAHTFQRLWKDLIDRSGNKMTIENCHQGGEPPNATWCPFDLWRTTGDALIVGWDSEVLKTEAALDTARHGDTC